MSTHGHGHGACSWLHRRPPPRGVHRAPARRPRPGAGVQPPADRRDRRLHRHHGRHRRAGPGPPALHVGGRGRRADPGPAGEGHGRAGRRAPARRAEPRRGGGAPGSRNAARPTIAARGATTLVAWLEWQEGRGDRLVAALAGEPATVVKGPEDLFRPTAAITADGTPWLLFGRAVGGQVGVWACHLSAGSWTAPEPVSCTDGPSFNQEVLAHPDGSLQCAGRAGSTDDSGSSPGAGRTAPGPRRYG